jgi:hypothetical protein
MDAKILYWLMIALAGAPVPLFALAWAWSIRDAKLHRSFWVMGIGTASIAWAILAWNLPWALGPSHSRLRYAIIDANFFAILACSVIAFRSKGTSQRIAGAACLATTLLWGLIAAVNSVA